MPFIPSRCSLFSLIAVGTAAGAGAQFIDEPRAYADGGGDLYYIKHQGTADGKIEVHAATAESGYKTASRHEISLFSTGDHNNGAFEICTIGAGSTNSGGRLNNAIIAAANSHPDGSYGGQCATWAEGVIVEAGGPSITLGLDFSQYQAGWSNWCTEQTWSTVAPGDICQWYDPAVGPHTAIMTGTQSPDTATVIDSNYGYTETVHRGTWASRNAGFAPGTYRFWRVN